MRDATFACPDLSAFCRLDDLGLVVTGQRLEPDRAVLACRVLEPDGWCRRCGCEGAPRDTVTRQLVHEPFGWRPTILLVTLRRYRCTGCGHVWRQDTSAAAEPRAKLSRHAMRWALEGIVLAHLTIARVAEGLGLAWHTANDAVLADGRRVVTVLIDLTPVRDGTGPARLLDMVEGRSKQVFKSWLDAQDRAFRDGIEVVATDGFTGFKTAAAETVPDAVAVMGPFHVAALAGDALDRRRQRRQQQIHGHGGRTGDPPYGIRRVLRTGCEYLTERQTQRLHAVFADDRNVAVEATWGIYQRIITAYRNPDRRAGKVEMRSLIDAISRTVPDGLAELTTLGRTLRRRAADVLAYFDRPGTSNGPTEAINGRLEHLRGSALGFRNLTNYIARSLLENRRLQTAATPSIAMSR